MCQMDFYQYPTAFNVTPDPLKFVQMNSRFWDVSRDVADEEADETKPNWQRLGYRYPTKQSAPQFMGNKAFKK